MMSSATTNELQPATPPGTPTQRVHHSSPLKRKRDANESDSEDIEENKDLSNKKVVKKRIRKMCDCGARDGAGKLIDHWSITHTKCLKGKVEAIKALEQQLKDATSSPLIPAIAISPVKRRWYEDVVAVREQNKKLEATNAALEASNAALQEENKHLKALNTTLKSQLAVLVSENAQLKQKVAKQTANANMNAIVIKRAHDMVCAKLNARKYHTILSAK